MAYAPHLRLTLSGEIRGGASGSTVLERFSTRLNLSNPTGGADQFTQERVQDYADDAVAFWSRGTSQIGSAARLREVKCAVIGADGKYVEDPIIIPVDQAGLGTGGTIKYPTQVAMAVSLDTSRRGPRGRGRVYLPCPVAAMDANYTIDATDANGIRDSFATFVNALNNVPGIDGIAPKVVVASSFGFNTDVDEIRVGVVLDTIRSRRAQLLESYSAPAAIA